MEQLSFLSQNSSSSSHERSTENKSVPFWKLYVDGASRNNPGPAGAGVYLLKNGKEVVKKGFFLGTKTNNQAEYLALIIGLLYFKDHVVESNELISIYSDSQLMISQLNGTYRVKNGALQLYYRIARELLQHYNYVLHHVLRHNNIQADALANHGINKHISPPQEYIGILQSHGIEL